MFFTHDRGYNTGLVEHRSGLVTSWMLGARQRSSEDLLEDVTAELDGFEDIARTRAEGTAGIDPGLDTSAEIGLLLKLRGHFAVTTGGLRGADQYTEISNWLPDRPPWTLSLDAAHTRRSGV